MDAKLAETLLDMATGQGGDGDGDDPEQQQEEELDEEQTIVEEYKLWRKNCKYMYSFVSETALTWPSLSVQFFKGNTFINKTKDDKYSVARNLLLTTHSSGEDEDFIKIASMQLPRSIIDSKIKLTSNELETVNSRLKISKKIKQNIEVNKIRINPFDNRKFASINANGEVYVYETDEKMNISKEHSLKHHSENGFGLSWDPNNEYSLITGSEDKSIAIWDYSKQSTPIRVYGDEHSNYVNDVRFSYLKKGIFGSVGEDSQFILGDNDKIHMKVNMNKVMNSLTFSPFSENLIMFGSEDSNNYIYDLRKMDEQLHVLVGHNDSITNVEWDPFHENIVASSSMDRRVVLWDLNKIGEEQSQEESEDGVPELLMMHGGHTGGVNDFAFNPETPWLLASCSDDNIVHVWAAKEDVVQPKPIDLPIGVL